MPPRFFLSYARANNSPLVRKFFDDLCLTIRGALGLPRSEPVGFYEENRPDDKWSAGASEALQSCTAMVCLLSPAYFHSELAGQEWQLFEMRRRNYGQRPAPVILPVSWISTNGPMPEVVNEMRSLPDSIYQAQPIVTMFKSASLAEYNEFVKTLAYKIIDSTAQVGPLPLKPFPSMTDVQNAFYLWDGPARPSDQCRAKVVDTEPIRPAPLKESTNPTTSNQGSESIDASNYSVLAISTKEELLNQIEDWCLFSPFDLKRSDDRDRSMDHIRRRRSQRRDIPELFIIGAVDRIHETVEDLTEKMNVPSGLLVIPGKFDQAARRQFMGATSIVFEPLDRDELIEQMEHCASIGRKMRLYDATKKRDLTRKRQVFLSYCSENLSIAHAIRRKLEAEDVGVSYMDEVAPGVEWEDEIAGWINQARIFLALVTPKYLDSRFCQGELGKFIRGLDEPKSDSTARKKRKYPMLAVYDSPDIDHNEVTKECKKRFQLVEITDGNFDNDLEKLVSTIQTHLNDGED